MISLTGCMWCLLRNGTHHLGSGVMVAAMRPPLKRINSFRRTASQRLSSRRPASLVVTAAPDFPSQCDQNGVAKCSSTDGPAAWAYSFEKLLEDPLGLHTFAEFLKKEFSAENIYFWTACERFRNLPAGIERANEAQRIYQQHLSNGAPEAVNVDAQGRQCTEQSLQDPNSNIFDLAQKQIFNLMKFDSYTRFLKSDIYKKCLTGQIDKCPFDSRLLIRVPVTPSKLKKSMSNAEDRLRKSFLPWNRKNNNRSKSKDREIEYSKKSGDDCVSIGSDIVRNDRTCLSNGSSLTSLDLAVAHQENLNSITNRDDLSSGYQRTALCRILLSNGSTTVVQIKDSETIQELVKKLLERRALNYSSFEVYTDKHEKPLDINEPSAKLSGCEVIVEQRVIFKLDLPNRKTISIKSKYTKIIIDVLRPSLHKYNYNLDQVLVLNENRPIDLHLPVTSIDGMRLNVQLLDEPKKSNQMISIRVDGAKPNKLDEITNKVFERILQEKADTARMMKPIKSDKGSTKSEDFGSEHSSTLIGKFLRRDSGVHDKKKKLPRIRGGNDESEGDHSSLAKPLIAKWKSGASKLHVTCSESDDLVEGLTRAQRCRLEDQRGTEINFELPDFLKDKESEQQHVEQKSTERLCNNNINNNGNTRFYTEPSNNYTEGVPIVASAKNMKLQLHSNYENRKILASSTSKYYSDHQSTSSSNSYGNRKSRAMENSIQSSAPTTVLEDAIISSPRQEPPPLPPKPKVIPIRPPNWGQLNGLYKPKTAITTTSNRNQAMFLEQSSSSFV